MRGNQKRGQCDACPSVKRVIPVKMGAVRANLCEFCRLKLSQIAREHQEEQDVHKRLVKAAGAYRSPEELEVMAEKLMAGYLPE